MSNEKTMTKAGIRPSTTELPFSVKTSDAENYLQSRFDLLPGVLKGTKVILLTTEVSKIFLPFIILLPTTVVKGSNKRNGGGENELSLFNPDESDSSRVQLQQEVYATLAPYVYNKTDEQAFFSPNWARMCNVGTQKAQMLKYTRTPHIQKYGQSKHKFVAMLIDPIRLFHDMLSDVNSKENFRISISGSEKIRDGHFKYNVVKTANGHKDRDELNYEEMIAKELNRRMGK